jgi:3-dehydroquinate dehydratase-2
VKIAILNGPNLNLLGTREPAIYGTTTLADIARRLRTVARELGVQLSFAQHNGEGELIDAIHGLRGKAAGAIVNAGAYSHSSLAIRDALTGVEVPFVELHLTNVFAREPERRHSMLAPAARAVLCGFGSDGYELALRGLVATLQAASAAPVASHIQATPPETRRTVIARPVTPPAPPATSVKSRIQATPPETRRAIGAPRPTPTGPGTSSRRKRRG